MHDELASSECTHTPSLFAAAEAAAAQARPLCSGARRPLRLGARRTRLAVYGPGTWRSETIYVPRREQRAGYLPGSPAPREGSVRGAVSCEASQLDLTPTV